MLSGLFGTFFNLFSMSFVREVEQILRSEYSKSENDEGKDEDLIGDQWKIT